MFYLFYPYFFVLIGMKNDNIYIKTICGAIVKTPPLLVLLVIIMLFFNQFSAKFHRQANWGLNNITWGQHYISSGSS
jgi:hypothetical protein